MITTILLVVALVLFVLGAINTAVRFNLIAAGLAFVTLAQILSRVAFILCVLALAACSSTDPNQKAAQAKVAATVENVALDAATSAALQYGTGGNVDSKKLAVGALQQAASDLKSAQAPSPAVQSAK